MTEDDASKIFSPNLKILNAQELTRERKFGTTDSDYFWFNLPHQLEIQQTFKVTIYCSFDFSYFPFDSHYCDFTHGSSKLSNNYLYLSHAWIRYGLKVAKHVKKPIHVEQSHLPFDIILESKETFTVFEAGFNYSFAGMGIHLKRNSLGLLIGGFYGPTAIFTLLSLISFTINPDIVTFIIYHIHPVWLIRNTFIRNA